MKCKSAVGAHLYGCPLWDRHKALSLHISSGFTIDYHLCVIRVLQIMAKEKHKQSDVMGVFSLRLDKQMIEDARSKAKKEGRAISVVLRKMVDDWLSNRYKPFEDS